MIQLLNQYETLSEAITKMALKGYLYSFKFENKKLYCIEKKSFYLPNQLKIKEYHRFEGDSNPEDSAILYALDCIDGTKGILIDTYGYQASAGLSEFLTMVN